MDRPDDDRVAVAVELDEVVDGQRAGEFSEGGGLAPFEPNASIPHGMLDGVAGVRQVNRERPRDDGRTHIAGQLGAPPEQERGRRPLLDSAAHRP